MVDLQKELMSVPQDNTFGIMLEEMQTLNKIALIKAEDQVIRGILRGKSLNVITDELKKDYPSEEIFKSDVEKFVVLYQNEIMKQKMDLEKGYTRRLLRTKEGLNNQMADLAAKAQDMVNRYDEAGDNTNAVAALRAAADIFMKFAKVEGLIKDAPEINVNMQMDKMVTEITTSDSDFKKSILKIINTPIPESEEIIEASFKVDDNE